MSHATRRLPIVILVTAGVLLLVAAVRTDRARRPAARRRATAPPRPSPAVRGADGLAGGARRAASSRSDAIRVGVRRLSRAT